jgi:2-polyprenyl-3-methyl-5-hydroxy-6-metoxy-1,4-benzoquinol methylase
MRVWEGVSVVVQRFPQSRARGGDPVYVEGASRRDLFAHFPSGAIVRVSRDRRRAYPKLAGEAPPTRAVYGALARILSRDARIIDAGCGSGAGAARLTEHFDRVLGYDCDPEAIAFAREYAPLGSFEQRDITEGTIDEPRDAAVLCDVLGHLKEPGSAVKRISAGLVPGGTLLVAEPAAHVGQILSSPARRAYSKASLSALLLRSGAEPLYFPCEIGTFVVCVAEATKRADVLALAEGEEARRRGQFDAAFSGFERAAKSDVARVRREALIAEGEARLSVGDGDGAVRALLAARQIDDADGRPAALLARLSFSSGRSQDALSLALAAIEREPTDAGAACVAARAAELLGHPDAIAAWRIAHSLAPDDIGVATELARSSAAVGDYRSGIMAFERLRKYGDPVGAMFSVTLGWLLLADGRVADAALEARLAAALAPTESAVAELFGAIDQARNPARNALPKG